MQKDLLKNNELLISYNKLPSAFELTKDFRNQFGQVKPAIFLDYDGTLTPIVDDPEKALLSAPMKEAIETLSNLCTVSIVSGRDRPNVAGKVGLPSLTYAGSHGYDIAGPGMSMVHEKGVECLPDLDQAEEELKERLKDIPAAKIERKKFAIAVHYRHVAEKSTDEVLSIVDLVLKKYEKLKPGPGKKIMELKPAFEWNKGKALWWLIGEMDSSEDSLPIYIGDDMTDEDAFKALTGKGLGILVGDHGEKSAANYKLKDPEEVLVFLNSLIEMLKQ
jgi:trehalose 6-phosphate phosphatase